MVGDVAPGHGNVDIILRILAIPLFVMGVMGSPARFAVLSSRGSGFWPRLAPLRRGFLCAAVEGALMSLDGPVI
jgi:hypothetical protein